MLPLQVTAAAAAGKAILELGRKALTGRGAGAGNGEDSPQGVNTVSNPAAVAVQCDARMGTQPQSC